MSVEVWTWLIVGLTFLGYLYIGYANRVRSTKEFYVAGGDIPATVNGAATAADWMSAASFISLAGIISFLGYDGAIYLMGWTGGYVLLALLLAPYLRKFGKYTVPDFVGDRYYSQTARVIAAIAAIFISLTYVAGQMRGVGIVFSRFLGVTITTGVIVGMFMVAFFSVLGGMKGITWTQAMQYGILIIAYLIPAIALAMILTGIPIPQIAFTFSDIVPRLNDIQTDLGLGSYGQPFTERSMLNVFMITVALMVGTAGLPHVIVRFYTVPSVRAARYSAFWALLFIALLYTTAPALAVFAKYSLIQTLHGQSVAQAEQVNWVNKWQQTGLLTLEDRDGDGTLQLRDDPATTDIVIDRDIIVLATSEMAGLAAPIVALVAAGALAAALSTASGLLLVLSSSVSHDIYYSLINPRASEGQRLLVGRVVMGVAVIAAGYLGINPPGFVAQVVAFAFGLAAASFFPIIILGIFDARMNNIGAIGGMTVGLVFTLFYIVQVQFFGVEPWFFGISAEGIGTVGMIFNFIVAFGLSRVTSAPPRHIQEMVEMVRIPTGAGAATEH
jgi:cation/acetate symporter